jgi:hypothetical protein
MNGLEQGSADEQQTATKSKYPLFDRPGLFPSLDTRVRYFLRTPSFVLTVVAQHLDAEKTFLGSNQPIVASSTSM